MNAPVVAQKSNVGVKNNGVKKNVAKPPVNKSRAVVRKPVTKQVNKPQSRLGNTPAPAPKPKP